MLFNHVNLPSPTLQGSLDTLEEVEQALQHAKSDPRDERWESLLLYAQDDKGINTAKSLEIYEAAIECFPNTVRFFATPSPGNITMHSQPAIQLAYAKAVSNNSHQTPGEIEDLFKSYLKTPSVALCTLYLSYLRERRLSTSLSDVYKYVLDLVGHEAESSPLWTEYLAVLEEKQDYTTLREILHQVVKIPLKDLPVFWELLEAYENKHHKSTAEHTIAGLLPSYIRALRVYDDYQCHIHLLYPLSASATQRSSCRSDTLLLPASPVSSFSGGQLVRRWEAYLRWEESDPLSLRQGNMTAYTKRLRSAYVKATVRVRFCPELWYTAYRWWLSIGDADEAFVCLKMGIKANNDSLLLNIALALALEARNDEDQTKTLYQQLLENLRTAFRSNLQHFAADDIAKDLGVVYTMYMRFELRKSGLIAAWSVFRQAMNDTPAAPWLVFEEAAKLAFGNGNNKEFALSAFEAGMVHYSQEIDYVTCYLDWLISIDDRTRAQTLFESVIDTFSREDARQLWDRWSRYMYRAGDLESIQAAEQRMAKDYGLADLRRSLALFSGANLTFTRNVTRKDVAAQKAIPEQRQQ
ncbi:mRNA 3'-end-processing protein rna14 [Paramarasmius palmivorus]|uniref:mRNA 3'-end-processing protein RNA14 n=1 Tax=Paramarasmius palmivorus TaxID=297713 RepID=A0AAW0C403_9AGAR